MSDSRGRLLFISPQPFFEWRGSPIRIASNVQILAEAGFEVDLLTLPVGEEKTIPGVRVLRVPNVIGARRLPIGPSLSKLVFDVVLLFAAARLARRMRYRYVHAVEDAGPIGLLAARLAGGRFVFEIHSDPDSYRGGWIRNIIMKAYACVMRRCIRRADAVIATGTGIAEQANQVRAGSRVVSIADVPSSRMEPDPDRAAEHRAELLKGDESRLVTYVGSFATYQGVDIVFEMMPIVRASRADVRFVIIGGSEEEIEERRSWLRERNVADAVSFMGRMSPDDLPHALRASDILLCPRAGGTNSPLKLMDYMKAARAILAADAPANRVLLDESIAQLVPATADGFANGTLELLNDVERSERLGSAARKVFDESYGLDRFRLQLVGVYDEMLERIDR
tara:strand:- start:418 stop:1602 length:1185 start_codon:yes stop_codon:yes gene_type:complete